MTKRIKRILWGIYYFIFGAIATVSAIAVAQIYIINLRYGGIAKDMDKFFNENGFTKEEILSVMGNAQEGSFLLIPEYTPYFLKIFSIIIIIALMFMLVPIIIRFIKQRKREGKYK